MEPLRHDRKLPIVGMPTSMGDMARVGLANECLSKINWSLIKTSSSLSLGTQHVCLDISYLASSSDATAHKKEQRRASARIKRRIYEFPE
jgi:hypothetical protein